MAPRELPGIGLEGYETLGQIGWNTFVDANWRIISAWLQARVKSVVAAVPTSGVSNGDTHLLTAGANANSMAIRDSDAWVYLAPRAGHKVYDEETQLTFVFDGASWSPQFADLTATANGALLTLRKRGSSAGATSSTELNGSIGLVQFTGWTGSAWKLGAQIIGQAQQLWSGAANGTAIVFQTIANGATTLADRMRLNATSLWVDVPITGAAAQKFPIFCLYSGSANAISLAYGQGALVVGQQVRFRATNANTGATTINLDGMGAVDCRTITGVALPAGYIRTDATTVAEFDGTYWVVDRQIERGSNADGAWVRFADGSLECHSVTLTQDVTTAAGSMYRSIAATWNLPVVMMNSAFTAYPGTLSNAATHWGSARPINAADVEYVIYSFGSYAGRNIRLSAVGRWY